MPKKQTSRNTPSKTAYLLLLAAAILLAALAFMLTKGRLPLSIPGNFTSHPADQAENMVYGLYYRPSSENILERGGFLLKNQKSFLQATEASSRITLKAADISARSSLPIVQFSEYVGYFYLYDGQTLYRTNIDGSQLRATIKNCQKYELMGNYIYSLKNDHGQSRLFRCSIIGTYEKMLFSQEILDFWAYNGNLFLKLTDGQYLCYNVLDKTSRTISLPEDAKEIALCREGILYVSAEGNEGRMALHCRSFLTQKDSILAEQETADYNVQSFCFSPSGIALLLSPLDDGSENKSNEVFAAWCGIDGSLFHLYKEKTFAPNAYLDMGTTWLFVTQADGTTWYTTLEEENWECLAAFISRSDG